MLIFYRQSIIDFKNLYFCIIMMKFIFQLITFYFIFRLVRSIVSNFSASNRKAPSPLKNEPSTPNFLTPKNEKVKIDKEDYIDFEEIKE